MRFSAKGKAWKLTLQKKLLIDIKPEHTVSLSLWVPIRIIFGYPAFSLLAYVLMDAIQCSRYSESRNIIQKIHVFFFTNLCTPSLLQVMTLWTFSYFALFGIKNWHTKYSFPVVTFLMHVFLLHQSIEFLAEFEHQEVQSSLWQIRLMSCVVHLLSPKV